MNAISGEKRTKRLIHALVVDGVYGRVVRLLCGVLFFLAVVSENGQSEQQQQQNETKGGMTMGDGAARWFAMAFFLYSAAAMLSFKIEQSSFCIV